MLRIRIALHFHKKKKQDIHNLTCDHDGKLQVGRSCLEQRDRFERYTRRKHFSKVSTVIVCLFSSEQYACSNIDLNLPWKVDSALEYKQPIPSKVNKNV